MAKYRQIYTRFWLDTRKWKTDERLFYLYLLTNEHASQCGIYYLPKDIIKAETGLSTPAIDRLLEKFQAEDKIIYSSETEEVAIKNWPKYNTIESPKVKSCIDKELKTIKNTVLIRYLYGIDIDPQEKRREEKRREGEKEGEEKPAPAPPIDQVFLDIQKAVEVETSKPILSTDLLKLIGDYKDFGMPLIAFKYAAAEMSLRNADYSYFKKIIESMFKFGVLSEEDLSRYKADREQKKQQPRAAPVKNNAESLKYIQRDYTEEDLSHIYANFRGPVPSVDLTEGMEDEE
jgi:hypothetical protein